MKGYRKHVPNHRGLSWPTVGTAWKRKSDGKTYEVRGSIIHILLEERCKDPGPMLKLTDLEAFYQEYAYLGKVKVHDE